MKTQNNFINLVCRHIVIFLVLPTLAFSQGTETTPDEFILFEGEMMHKIKDQISSGTLFPEIQALLKEADQKLLLGPFSVTHKEQLPPSGDIHDYTSMGPYWWPDPDKEDGLPYIRRDGEINPEYYEYRDKEELGKLMGALKTLSEAYFFSGETTYAVHAIRLIRAWFLDPATKMNPNLNFAQRIPGRTEGRGIGIIDTRRLADLPDILKMVSTSEHWSSEDQEGMKNWVGTYVDWLINSEHGKDEAVHGNNHTTWYFAQVIPLTLYLGQNNRADSLAKSGAPLILEEMIAQDGSQPKELARTKSWDYSAMNLLGIMTFAQACEEIGVDFWNYKNENGGSIKKALDYLVPYVRGKMDWEHDQISKMEVEKLKTPLNIAALKYQNRSYKRLADQLAGVDPEFSYWDLVDYKMLKN
jgi:hypothetical protein